VCLAASGRAEQVEVLDAELLQLGFVLLELDYGSSAIHPRSITEARQGQAFLQNATICRAKMREDAFTRVPPAGMNSDERLAVTALRQCRQVHQRA
jgi:hypothetical protein